MNNDFIAFCKYKYATSLCMDFNNFKKTVCPKNFWMQHWVSSFLVAIRKMVWQAFIIKEVKRLLVVAL